MSSSETIVVPHVLPPELLSRLQILLAQPDLTEVVFYLARRMKTTTTYNQWQVNMVTCQQKAVWSYVYGQEEHLEALKNVPWVYLVPLMTGMENIPRGRQHLQVSFHQDGWTRCWNLYQKELMGNPRRRFNWRFSQVAIDGILCRC